MGVAPSLSSLFEAVDARQEIPPLIVGERMNANGSRKFKKLLLADDYEAPESIQLNLGYSHRLGSSGLNLDVDAVHAEGENELVYRNVNFGGNSNPVMLNPDYTEIHRANSEQVVTLHPLDHCLPQPLPGKRVFPHQDRLEVFDDIGGILSARIECRSQESVSVDSLICADRDQSHLRTTAFVTRDLLVVASRRNTLPLPERHGHIRDLHTGCSSLSVVWIL